MNSLPFFPPPSRALSRLNDKPPPSPGLSRTNTQNNRPFSSIMSRASPSRGGTSHTPSSTTNEGNASQSALNLHAAGGSNTEKSTTRRATILGTSGTTESNRSPQLINDDKAFTKRPPSSGSSTPLTGGRLGSRLPPGMFLDLLRQSEVSAAYRLEVQGYSQEDGASLETLRYRQKEAPHLFFGAFLSMAPPKVSGPLTMVGPSQRKLIAYACGTAASALTARSMKIHSNDEDAWLVCLHSVCVAPEFQRRGVALKLIEEFMKRLRKAELGQGGPNLSKKGYECVALLAHEELFPLYIKAGFSVLGVSHVNWGSGGWFEMRRYINSDRQEEEEDGKGLKRTSSASALADGVTKALSPTLLPIETQPIHKVVSSVEMVASPDSTTSHLSHFKDVQLNEGKAAESDSPKDISPAENKEEAGGLAGFSSAQIMEALKKQSGGSTKTHDEGPRNPGTAYATIVGQTLAAKTTVEDAFFALEARLVDRESGTNLAEIYCPREECACLLLRAKEADWEVAELGPLASANLSLPNSPAPPTAPMPPPPSSLDRIRSAINSRKTSTPVRTFWTVYSPMAFENVGFSKDDDWIPPLPTPLQNTTSTETNDKSRPEPRKKPTKRASLFRGPSERKRDKEKDTYLDNETSPGSIAAASLNIGNSTLATPAPSEPVKVKYLLCADCDCGPLGYTVLPPSLQGGKLAQDVGKTLEGQQSISADSDKQEPPVYLIAADRVRYRFVKSG